MTKTNFRKSDVWDHQIYTPQIRSDPLISCQTFSDPLRSPGGGGGGGEEEEEEEVWGLRSGGSEVCGLKSGVWGLGSEVCGLKSGVWGLLSGVWGLKSKVWSLGSEARAAVFLYVMGSWRVGFVPERVMRFIGVARPPTCWTLNPKP